MRLADFIRRDTQPILAEWEVFAKTLPAARNMDKLALRDHAEQILQAIAKDLITAQSPEQQSAKSHGLAAKTENAPETAAQTHGLLRAQSGFEINQMASEYRALRATVLRLWFDACGREAPHTQDIVRFNEAIDQALAESVAFFSARVEQARNLFLGMLGHDMRTPLQAIQLTAVYLGQLNAGDKVSAAASRLVSSGARMKSLLDDLVEFNRANLGLGLPIVRSDLDMANLLSEELEQIRIAHPGCRLDFVVEGATRGAWDGVSVQRLVGNLVVNAIKYGAQGMPVRVVVSGEQDDVRVEVRNTGAGVEASELEQLFEPLKRGLAAESSPHDGLGLGLYIAREIAKAHGGELQARSEHAETVFAVRLPRHPTS